MSGTQEQQEQKQKGEVTVQLAHMVNGQVCDVDPKQDKQKQKKRTRALHKYEETLFEKINGRLHGCRAIFTLEGGVSPYALRCLPVLIDDGECAALLRLTWSKRFMPTQSSVYLADYYSQLIGMDEDTTLSVRIMEKSVNLYIPPHALRRLASFVETNDPTIWPRGGLGFGACAGAGFAYVSSLTPPTQPTTTTANASGPGTFLCACVGAVFGITSFTLMGWAIRQDKRADARKYALSCQEQRVPKTN